MKVRKYFAWSLWCLGLLTVFLSGACTLVAFVIDDWAAADVELILLIGGPPFAVGLVLFFVGRAIMPPKEGAQGGGEGRH